MILVFGQTGQVARALAEVAPEARFLSRAMADLSDPEACAAHIRAHRPKAVINAAAYTAVDRAEAEPDLAHRINADAPTAMARACADLGVPFVHISTDYVFDGQGTTPRKPDDPTGPINTYGATKLAGEAGVIAAGGVYAILRCSWVFAPEGQNFVTTMLRLGATRAELSVVADQIGGPTPASAIALACLQAADRLANDPALAGIYHFAGAPDLSWADFARAIMAEAGLPCVVRDIPSEAYPTPAARPRNSRLDCSSLARLGLSRPDWRAELAKTIARSTSPSEKD